MARTGWRALRWEDSRVSSKMKDLQNRTPVGLFATSMLDSTSSQRSRRLALEDLGVARRTVLATMPPGRSSVTHRWPLSCSKPACDRTDVYIMQKKRANARQTGTSRCTSGSRNSRSEDTRLRRRRQCSWSRLSSGLGERTMWNKRWRRRRSRAKRWWCLINESRWTTSTAAHSPLRRWAVCSQLLAGCYIWSLDGLQGMGQVKKSSVFTSTVLPVPWMGTGTCILGERNMWVT